ncbi:Isochorismate synthase @ Menaquinone-specific isochorismate synthase [hydrothermal vent metagenome]|uniref:isochorismate synthase n=1 Tax=hydrothermal vent metagenome TaxID=652676 RepID=A0A3B1BLD2_9ZZZZ
MKKNPTIENFLMQLAEQLEQLQAGWHWPENTRLCSLSLKPALPLPTGMADSLDDFYYTAEPERQRFSLGVGCAFEYKASQPQAARGSRFDDLQRAFKTLQSSWARLELEAGLDSDAVYSPVAAFIGFAFAAEDRMAAPWQDWPNTLLTVPAVLLQRQGTQLRLHLSATAECLRSPVQRQQQIHLWLKQSRQLLLALKYEGSKFEAGSSVGESGVCLQQIRSEPENHHWLNLVEQARQLIHAGDLAKVVPARHLSFKASQNLPTVKILETLSHRFPACTQLGLRRGTSTLLAASPEKLLRLEDGQIDCDALGGTLPRSDDTIENRVLKQELMQNPRIRREHALVVEQMIQALRPLSNTLPSPKTPSIMALRQLQHLWTPIHAQARTGINLLDIAARLHPTPAVAGTPTAVAQHWIRENEPFARGWYSGAVGWMDAHGNGELSVVLRCALVQGRQIDVYAGAGIVADSEPAAELEETELKLASILGVLNAGVSEQADELQRHSPRATGS